MFTKPKWYTECRTRGYNITLQQELSEVPPMHGHPTELREILINLIFNAVDAMPKAGTLTLRTRRESGQIILEVADTGVGMTERVRRHCFEPFFTTKGEHGTGMGLPMVHEILAHHGATTDIESEPGKGTTFRVRFPVETPAAAGEPSP